VAYVLCSLAWFAVIILNNLDCHISIDYATTIRNRCFLETETKSWSNPS